MFLITVNSLVLCHSLFGLLLIMSFCDFNFVMRHFKFLKTIVGKGLFNIFVASMFLVGTGGSIWGWLMFGAFLVLGIFFVADLFREKGEVLS